MIAANELRIGNWFQQDASNNNTISRFFTVDEIKRYGVRSTYIRQDTNQPHTSLFSLDSIYPIPLTPEILEKCGFVSNAYQDRYELGGIHVEYCAVRNILWVEKAPHIQYLHQLQNYVYANTNTELNYTP